jgi:hypothetical protein
VEGRFDQKDLLDLFEVDFAEGFLEDESKFFLIWMRTYLIPLIKLSRDFW